MVLSIMVPQFSAIGSGGVPLVPPTILMSAIMLNVPQYKIYIPASQTHKICQVTTQPMYHLALDYT